MNKDRDKFLTEAMGLNYPPNFPATVIDFSSWDGFGRLWEWANQQNWWNSFFHTSCHDGTEWFQIMINPERFSNAVYTFMSIHGVTTKPEDD